MEETIEVTLTFHALEDPLVFQLLREHPTGRARSRVLRNLVRIAAFHNATGALPSRHGEPPGKENPSGALPKTITAEGLANFSMGSGD